MSGKKFDVTIHGFTVYELKNNGDKVLFHEPRGVKYWGMNYPMLQGLNSIYGRVSDILTMMGTLLDLYGLAGPTMFMRELNWFVENAPERIGKKLAEGEAKK